MNVIDGPWGDRAGSAPGNPETCPACLKVTSVRHLAGRLWCDDCELAFEPGDHERVTPTWRAHFHELRASTGGEPLEEPQLDPLCATCHIRHPRRSHECV